MARVVLWLSAGVFSVVLTLLACLPAAYLNPLIESQTHGQFTLGDAQGSIWHGSAFIGGAPGGTAAITPLLPGRFSWHISPLSLLGRVEVTVENPDALSDAIHINGNWHEWSISPGAISLPAERLAGLGAPLNTIQPTGTMRLHWQPLKLDYAQGTTKLTGQMELAMQDIASRLSPIKPLGAYNLGMDWHGQTVVVTLTTIKGPMMLDGSGTLNNGRLAFSGTAQAAAGQEERLANLLNLLGQHRIVNGKDVIALEFK